MNTKLLTALLACTFLVWFSCSFTDEEPEVKKEYWDNGTLKLESHYKNEKKEGVETDWYESGAKVGETHYKKSIAGRYIV